MADMSRTVAIVDYGLGNLRSIEQACLTAGLEPTITSDARSILAADAVILPGMGAFGDAMATLHRLDLVHVLRDVAASETPLLGVCLGVQLLMTESFEFGRHRGLGVIEGQVVRFDRPREGGRALKVPQIGWNTIQCRSGAADLWASGPLQGVRSGEFMYFVHSYVVEPQDASVVVSSTTYGDREFCSSLQRGELFACQFHPERSGAAGLRIYANLAARISTKTQGVAR